MKSSENHESQRKRGRWLIEAVAPVRFTYRGQEILLEPGQRIRLPDRPVQQLMARVGNCVKLVDWLALWQQVAECSAGLEPGDPRFGPAITLIEQLDKAFEQDDLLGFSEGVDELREVMTISKHDA